MLVDSSFGVIVMVAAAVVVVVIALADTMYICVCAFCFFFHCYQCESFLPSSHSSSENMLNENKTHTHQIDTLTCEMKNKRVQIATWLLATVHLAVRMCVSV